MAAAALAKCRRTIGDLVAALPSLAELRLDGRWWASRFRTVEFLSKLRTSALQSLKFCHWQGSMTDEIMFLARCAREHRRHDEEHRERRPQQHGSDHLPRGGAHPNSSNDQAVAADARAAPMMHRAATAHLTKLVLNCSDSPSHVNAEALDALRWLALHQLRELRLIGVVLPPSFAVVRSAALDASAASVDRSTESTIESSCSVPTLRSFRYEQIDGAVDSTAPYELVRPAALGGSLRELSVRDRSPAHALRLAVCAPALERLRLGPAALHTNTVYNERRTDLLALFAATATPTTMSALTDLRIESADMTTAEVVALLERTPKLKRFKLRRASDDPGVVVTALSRCCPALTRATFELPHKYDERLLLQPNISGAASNNVETTSFAHLRQLTLDTTRRFVFPARSLDALLVRCPALHTLGVLVTSEHIVEMWGALTRHCAHLTSLRIHDGIEHATMMERRDWPSPSATTTLSRLVSLELVGVMHAPLGVMLDCAPNLARLRLAHYDGRMTSLDVLLERAPRSLRLLDLCNFFCRDSRIRAYGAEAVRSLAASVRKHYEQVCTKPTEQPDIV